MAFMRENRKTVTVKDKKTGEVTSREYIYYSIVESYRENGKNRQRPLQYIGSIDKLKEFAILSYKKNVEAAANISNLENVSFIGYSHGAGMALYWIAEQLGFEKILDETFRPKTIKGMPRSRILLLAAIHRAVDPGSKRAFEGWVKTTSLPYHLGFDPEKLTSQVFWEAMDDITREQIQFAWNKFVARIMTEFGIEPGVIPLDYSNYYTWIDSRNGRCIMCKRGHNKQKRDDLRQFSIAATTTFDLRIPIIWSLYEGNKNDKSEFPDFVAYVRTALKGLGVDLTDITLSFDGGSNSEENFKDPGVHILCAHSLVSFPELYETELSDYVEITLNNGSRRLAYDVGELNFSGVDGKGVLTCSEDLRAGQAAEPEKKLRAATESVKDIRERLTNPRSRMYSSLKKRQAAAEAAIQKALDYNAEIQRELEKLAKEGRKKRGKPKKLKDIPVWDPAAVMSDIAADIVYDGRKMLKDFTTLTVQMQPDNSYVVDFTVDEDKKTKYCDRHYGKKLTCTDHKDWSTQRILQEYTNQECIENGVFKISKNVDHFSIRPQYHWTDDKIWVHTSLCLSALALAEVLRKKLEPEGIVITRTKLMDSLMKIQDGWILQDDKKVSRTTAMIEDEALSTLWNAILKIFGKLPV